MQHKKVHLTNEDKANMQKELDKILANNSLSFNDEAIINIGLESVKPITDLMMSKQLKMEESESTEEKVDNFTCESGEGLFQKNVESEKK